MVGIVSVEESHPWAGIKQHSSLDQIVPMVMPSLPVLAGRTGGKAVNARRTNADFLNRRRWACFVSCASRASVNLSEITTMARPRHYPAIFVAWQYDVWDCPAGRGVVLEGLRSPAPVRSSAGHSRPFLPILRPLAITWSPNALVVKVKIVLAAQVLGIVGLPCGAFR